MIKAKKIVVKLYVRRGNASDGFDSIYSQMNDHELAASLAIEAAEDTLFKKYGKVLDEVFDFGYYLHPTISDGQNAAFVNKNAYGLTPTIQIIADYGDSTAHYIVYPGLGDKFTGVNWQAADLIPYFEALLKAKFGDGRESLICKLLPVACKIPGWVWLAATVYGVKETLDAKGSPMAYVYGAGAFLSFDAFSRAGGFSSVGIGKIYKTSPPGKRQCADGKFTTANAGGACSYHKGLRRVKTGDIILPEPYDPPEYSRLIESVGGLLFYTFKGAMNKRYLTVIHEKSGILIADFLTITGRVKENIELAIKILSAVNWNKPAITIAKSDDHYKTVMKLKREFS